MARIKTKELFWTPSPSQDVIGTRIFYAIGRDAPVNEDSPSVLVRDSNAARLEIVLPVGIEDDVVSFAAAPEDDAGNLGDLYQHASWVNVPFDVIPPLPVSGGGIRES